jgi:hypothetical protein
MERVVEPELLDILAADDPGAIGSRRDLRRLNAWMGNAGLMAAALRTALGGRMPACLVELGAGDGGFFLAVARRLAGVASGRQTNSKLVLLDQQDLVQPATHRQLQALGWQTEVVKANALEWIKQAGGEPCDAMVANLFLHHFSDSQLASLLLEASRRTQVFIGLEPRRSWWASAFSRLVWLIGCNRVTQHDAAASVRAGFDGRELTRLWPETKGWCCQENKAGSFGHLFIAQRCLD